MGGKTINDPRNTINESPRFRIRLWLSEPRISKDFEKAY
jgi:hypothetical protein